MYNVTAADKLNDHYATFEIGAGDVASRAEPGQIVLASVGGAPACPCPVTGVSNENESLTILAPWSGTADAAGLEVALDGPFGGATADKAARVLCAAEGLGVAALVSRLEAYKARGAYTIVVAAYPTAAHVYWRDLVDGLSDELYIVTEDGSFGIKGPARDTVKAICENVPEIERIVAIGSIPLMKACVRIAERAELPLTVGLAAVGELRDAAASDAHEATAPPEEALREFDWTRTEFDGHKTDFDDLARKLGLQPSR